MGNQVANVCAARMLLECRAPTDWFNHGPLPHEPVMNAGAERWVVAQEETRLIAVDPRNSYEAIYVCQHCGLLYMD